MPEKTDNYERISEAIHFIQLNFRSQPSLEQIAAHLQLSPCHFQKLFTEWVGVSPKTFLKHISVNHAKTLLKENHNLSHTAFDTGLSGTSRLHDLFVNIEAMTLGEYRNGAADLIIKFRVTDSLFGKIIIACTAKGICYIAFYNDQEKAINDLKKKYTGAICIEENDKMQEEVMPAFCDDWQQPLKIKLHLRGSPFQIKVWETLLQIPRASLTTYGNVAQKIDQPNASRAVGTAIGANPVALIIPCHRVIQKTGSIGGYRWGEPRKAAIIGWESCKDQK